MGRRRWEHMSDPRDQSILWQGHPHPFLMVRNLGLPLLGLSIVLYWWGNWALLPWDAANCTYLSGHRCYPFWILSRIALVPFSLIVVFGWLFFILWLTGLHRQSFCISSEVVTYRIEGVFYKETRVDLYETTAESKGSTLSFFLGQQEKVRFHSLRAKQVYAAMLAYSLAKKNKRHVTPTGSELEPTDDARALGATA